MPLRTWRATLVLSPSQRHHQHQHSSSPSFASPPHHIRESGFGECAHGFLHAMHRSRSCSESGAAAHVGAGIMDVAHGPSRDW